MPAPGSQHDLPEKYRLALALSIALLAHTLLVSLSTLLLQQPARPPLQTSMAVTLVPVGCQPATPKRLAPDSVQQTEPAPMTPQITTNAQQNKALPTANKLPDAPSRQKQVAQAPSKAGAQQPVPAQPVTEASISQLTESAEPPDPFIQALMNRIAIALPAQPGQADLTQLGKAVSVELELYLTSTGTLKKATVSRSSGTREIDRWAYRAALSSSPYPEPPEEHTEKDRYRVEIRFHPERL